MIFRLVRVDLSKTPKCRESESTDSQSRHESTPRMWESESESKDVDSQKQGVESRAVRLPKLESRSRSRESGVDSRSRLPNSINYKRGLLFISTVKVAQ
jgi:hypothetical protein